ncbi:MAG: GGDEF domain-containing protein [Armatimonadota bacterium]|nr:GGDEF domain-containing protein [Armatimonadota bacterium]MDR5703569.1 GGDEF domain-containing protein [Armatimonadota bacterium]MDR7435147.1 GGDEF domain-containing protein [Armatimonadota bacterium]
MKTVRQLMTQQVVAVSPIQTVASAIELMREHGLSVLPVVEGKALLGLVTLQDLIRQPIYREIGQITSPAPATIHPDASLHSTYELMKAHRTSSLPVVENGEFVGIITLIDILPELGKLIDPLTELPWPGTLRLQAVEYLREGKEIAILFIDMDDFGAINKAYGHVLGDRVIQAVARSLVELVDPKRDVLCRYGGDEFVVVTLLSKPEAEVLAQRIWEAIVSISVPGVPQGAVKASIGISGGKRTVERHDIHYAATVDDLLTLASRASTIAKRMGLPFLHSHDVPRAVAGETASMETPLPPVEKPQEPPPSPPRKPEEKAPRVRLQGYEICISRQKVSASVEVTYKGTAYRGEASGVIAGRSEERLLAEATLGAISSLLPAPYWATLGEITYTSMDGRTAVHVHVVLGTPTGEEHLLGSVFSAEDPYEAVVKAALKALNRKLEVLLSPHPS